MTDKFETVRLRILGEDYTIACEPDDRELLKNAAPLLDDQIDAVQQQDPLLDTTSVFMLAGLKLATTLLQSRGEIESAKGEGERIRREFEQGSTENLGSLRSVRRRVERHLQRVSAESA